VRVAFPERFCLQRDPEDATDRCLELLDEWRREPGYFNAQYLLNPVSADTAHFPRLDPKGQQSTLTLDRASRFGSLQTIFDGSRSLLVATSNGAPEQLDGLLNWLSGERGRWADLDGRAIIAMPSSEPVTIPNPAPGLAAAAGPTQPAANTKWWVIGSAAAVVVAVGIGLVRRRRSG
jgi:hypothetical protein